MNVNKKLGRFKQWAGERMGTEVRTTLTDDFKALEAEMNLRNEGLNNNHKAMAAYIRTISQRSEGDNKEKIMPVAYMGQNMTAHGEDFESDSEYGRCLIVMGRTQERISRIQETYVSQCNSTWMDSLERSLAQMKEYQSSRKKLESRRLAYDAAQAKLQKSTRDDFRAEDEARTQKVKFEEANEDVVRRMQDIQESEADSLEELSEFLDAELNYYARCHEALLQLKKEWPTNGDRGLSRTSTRSFNPIDEDPQGLERPAIRSIRSNGSSTAHSPVREFAGAELAARPGIQRATTCSDSAVSESGFLAASRKTRTRSDNLNIRAQNARLRGAPTTDVFDDTTDHSSCFSNGTSSPDRAYGERGVSPATSVASSTGSGTRRKPPPPPPPPRSTKPPPPPPPMKRSGLSSSYATA